MARIRTLKPEFATSPAKPYKKRAIPQATRRAVALAAGGVPGEQTPAACHWCGAEGAVVWPRLYSGRPGAWVYFDRLQLDHLVPERRGGGMEPENFVLACQPCNGRRADRHGDGPPPAPWSRNR